MIARETLQTFFRESYGQVCALLIRRFGDMDLAQEAIQEAFLVAIDKWNDDGVPENVPGWIFAVARHKAIDILRREQLRDKKYRSLQSGQTLFSEAVQEDDFATASLSEEIPDERLRLIFTCCHPVINPESRVALTLHTLAGLTTTEIAAAFLKSEATIAQRLVRAKRKIRDAGVPFRVPALTEIPERLSSVLTVLYLIFNEGYSAHGGAELMRRELCDEAIGLARMLASLMPDRSEVSAQLALFYFQSSRIAARLDEAGRPVTLEHQDRELWDRDRIDRGRIALRHSLRAAQAEAAAARRDSPEHGPNARAGTPDDIASSGPYQLQARIAASHATAATYSETNWSRIVLYYEALYRISPTPVIRLNLAVAVAMDRGPAAGLAMLDAKDLAAELAEYHWYHLARAELLARQIIKNGNDSQSNNDSDDDHARASAATAYRRALDLCNNESECGFIRRRLEELG